MSMPNASKMFDINVVTIKKKVILPKKKIKT